MKKIVVLDSNILCSDFSLASQRVTTLIDYVRRLGHRIILSRLVVDEVVARYGAEVIKRASTLSKAQAAYRQLVREGTNAPVPSPEVGTHEDAFRTRLLARFGVGEGDLVPYDEKHMVEALRRAMYRRPPCSEKGEEIRDAVLWLQALSLCRSDALLCFVSSDRRAYAESPDELKPDLRREVDCTPGDLRYFSSLESFLRATAEKVSFITGEWVQEHLSKERILDAAIVEIERLGGQNLDRVLASNEEPTGDVVAVNYDIGFQDHYVHELLSGEYVVEAVWGGSAEVEGGYFRRTSEHGPLFDWPRTGHRCVEFEIGVVVEMIVTESGLERWSVVEVTDAV